MKKLYRLSLLTASLLVASTASFAAPSYKGEAAPSYKDQAPCPAPLTLKDGFYVGGQVGYDSYRLRANTNVTSPDGSVSASSNPVYNATGFVGGLFVGYGQYFNNMGYLGLEVFGNDSGASVSQNRTVTLNPGAGSVSSNSSVDVNGSYGISLLPGLKLNDATLGYIRLGYNRVRFHTSGSLSESFGPSSSVSGSNNKWEGGFNYGLGLETAFYENWSARTEFTHTNFSSFSSNVTSVNPSDNQFMLGLIYHFA